MQKTVRPLAALTEKTICQLFDFMATDRKAYLQSLGKLYLLISHQTSGSIDNKIERFHRLLDAIQRAHEETMDKIHAAITPENCMEAMRFDQEIDRRNKDLRLFKDAGTHALLYDKDETIKNRTAELLAELRRNARRPAPALTPDQVESQMAYIKRTRNLTDDERTAAILRTEGKSCPEIACRLKYRHPKTRKPMSRTGVKKLLDRAVAKLGIAGLFRAESYRAAVQADNDPKKYKPRMHY